MNISNEAHLLSAAIAEQVCSRCDRRYPPEPKRYVCDCEGTLLFRYDLQYATRELEREQLQARPWSMWRYRELLPLGGSVEPETMGEGGTALVRASALGALLGLDWLLIKDEGRNPTASFKARGAAVGISILKRLGIGHLGVVTAGNTGAAWSAYAARAGIPITVVMAQSPPMAAIKDALSVGAATVVVEGSEDDANVHLRDAVERHGWFNVGKGPYRIEGKKTIGFELAEQLSWNTPEVVLFPTGPGNGILALWKALNELVEIGWIPEGQRPALVAVQSERSAPYVTAIEQGASECIRHAFAVSVAPGIIIDKPPIGKMVLRALRETGGTAVGVSDDEILHWMRQASLSEGLSFSPEGASTLAAAARLRESGYLRQDTRVVCVNTASGLRYHHLLDGTPRYVQPHTKV